MSTAAYIDTDVLVIGAGGAGMCAAIAAGRAGARVLLADRSLIGRGGATIMAQMTVAAALGEEGEDDWRFHYADTLAAGRGLCSEPLARVLCEDGVDAIRELDAWGAGWARDGDRLAQVQAPGHDRPRCVYVDFLDTGPALARTLRTQVARTPGVQRAGNIIVTELLREGEQVVGALAVHLATGRPLVIGAGATIVATGGLTRLYQRNSASANMGGDGYALAIKAGAELIDMEFVQFFPIGHLAPRLVGFDPIMWDPFRYKLGGRLLNGLGEPFVESYGHASDAKGYTVTRDAATYAILKEVEAGRGSPAGGAWLSFTHVPPETLQAAFGPIIAKLAAAGIDLTRDRIEVSPIAHYHMGGIRVDTDMATRVPGLYAAGEAVGGANGANRLSGNAITEAVAFGLRAGASAAAHAASAPRAQASRLHALAAAGLAELQSSERAVQPVAAHISRLQDIMQRGVGPFRTDAGLRQALAELTALRDDVGDTLAGTPVPHDAVRAGALDLRAMLLVAECVTRAALLRTESRGAHQREDHPGLDDEHWRVNQVVTWADGAWSFTRAAVPRLPELTPETQGAH